MSEKSTQIEYVVGDATQPIGDGPRIITHVCNDIGGWGRGFVVALSNRWKEPEAEYRAWSRGERDTPFALGEVQLVEVEKELWVANLIGQHKTSSIDGVPPVRYEAIEAGLTHVAGLATSRDATVHMPRIGCGLAGGKWDTLGDIVEQVLCGNGVATVVYDLAGS